MGYGRILIPYEVIRSLTYSKSAPEFAAKLSFCEACNPDLPEKMRELIGLPSEFKVINCHYDYSVYGVGITVEHPDLPEVKEGEYLPIVRPICYQQYYPKLDYARQFVTHVTFELANGETKRIDLISIETLQKEAENE